jgi:hypothetical protein
MRKRVLLAVLLMMFATTALADGYQSGPTLGGLQISGGTLQWPLMATSWPYVDLAGDLTLTTWTLAVQDAGGIPDPLAQYDIFHFGGNLPNGLGNYTITTATGTTWDTSHASLGVANYNENRQMVYMTGLAVPEPGSVALLASGALGLLAYAWRRRKVLFLG